MYSQNFLEINLSSYISDILLPFSQRTHMCIANMSLYIKKLHLKVFESTLIKSGGYMKPWL